MTPSYGPSIEHFLIVFGFIVLILTVFYFFKKNRHLISSKLHNKKRMKVSEVTMLGQGDRALILSLDNKDFLFISGLAMPFSKLTPRDITLLPLGFVLIPLKFWSTDAWNPLVGAIILSALDSKDKTLDSVVIPA